MTAQKTQTKRLGQRRARARSPERRPAGRAAWRASRRRRIAVAAILGVGLLGGLVLTQVDKLEETIREVTLPLRHDDVIRQQAAEKDLDPALISAVIYAESRFREQTSEAGARGLMQITPKTARYIERLSGGRTFVLDDLANPDINIRYGSYYLRYLLDRYGESRVAALAAYHAGETKVDSWGGEGVELGDIRFDETRHYVQEVLDKREEYRDNYADDLGL